MISFNTLLRDVEVRERDRYSNLKNDTKNIPLQVVLRNLIDFGVVDLSGYNDKIVNLLLYYDMTCILVDYLRVQKVDKYKKINNELFYNCLNKNKNDPNIDMIFKECMRLNILDLDNKTTKGEQRWS